MLRRLSRVVSPQVPPRLQRVRIAARGSGQVRLDIWNSRTNDEREAEWEREEEDKEEKEV